MLYVTESSGQMIMPQRWKSSYVFLYLLKCIPYYIKYFINGCERSLLLNWVNALKPHNTGNKKGVCSASDLYQYFLEAN